MIETIASITHQNGEAYIARETLRSLGDAEEVWLRPHLAGLCSADLKEVTGSRKGRSIFGHELVGKVEKDSSGRLQGKWVTFNPNVEVERTTAFATLMRVSGPVTGLKEAIIPLPEDLVGEEGLFSEPVAVACHVLRRLAEENQAVLFRRARVGIIGAGIFALLIYLLVRDRGMSSHVYNKGTNRLQWLSRRGLAIEEDDFRPWTLMEPSSCDAVCLATRKITGEILSAGGRLVKPGGTVLLFGGTSLGDRVIEGSGFDADRVRRDERGVWLGVDGKRFRVVGSYGADASDFAEAFRELQSSLNLGGLITERISLGQLPERINKIVRTGEAYLGRIVVQVSGPEEALRYLDKAK